MANLHLSLKHLPFLLLVILHPSFELTIDGILLFSFKYSVLKDPLGVLKTWNYEDDTPCAWNGVICKSSDIPFSYYRVTGLSLPNSQLTASIPADLGLIEHLRELNLSNNSINGSIPLSLYNAPELQLLDFSYNLISGELFGFVGAWRGLRILNVSGNLFTGKLPENLAALPNLTVVSLKGNHFHGELSGGFHYVKVLDLSSNFINGSLPEDFGSGGLDYLNVSHNNISGEIPPGFANQIPRNATLDLSYNILTGAIPESSLFFNQDEISFVGNPNLCGKPLQNVCVVPSSSSTPPNVSSDSTTYPPAIADITETIPSPRSSNSSNTPKASSKTRFGNGAIIGIVIGDIAIVAILALIFMYVLTKRQRGASESDNCQNPEKYSNKCFDWASSDEEQKGLRSWGCLMKRSTECEELSEYSSSESSETKMAAIARPKTETPTSKDTEKIGLVMVDGGEQELEVETLLKASAYILGSNGSSIIYKAVLEDGTTLAVRRIGENGLERFMDFKNRVRVIGKLVHPNLVRIRGFYWGADEKLVIYEYVPYGNLANARSNKVGLSSPSPLPWEARLKIATGTARGLLYIHDKKQVHGNLKPSNILLGFDMEPKIADFGLERLMVGNQSCKASGSGSARNFGSKRSSTSKESFSDIMIGSNPSPSPSAMVCISPYFAPESLKNLKPNTKWDVYSYGVVLLEILTGKVIISDEFGAGSMAWSSTLEDEEKKKVLRMIDVAIRGDMEGREDALLVLLKVAYSCISSVPHRRPHMKEVLHALEKFPSASVSFS